MNRKELFIDLLGKYFDDLVTREEVADYIRKGINKDSPENELLNNCEFALLHMDWTDYKLTDKELKYYLDCLLEKRVFSSDTRDFIKEENIDREELFIELLNGYFIGTLTRKQIASRVSHELLGYDFPKNELLDNCEDALFHMAEPSYWPTDGELKYYLECLIGKSIFSAEERDKRIAEGCKETELTRLNFLFSILEEYFRGKLSREEIASLMIKGVPKDRYPTDDLQDKCENAFRYINDPSHPITDGELRYYLDCFKQKKRFSAKERDRYIDQWKATLVSN